MKGSIRQHKEGGSYTAYWFTIDPGTGQRRQHSKAGFTTKAAAQRHLNYLLAQVQSGASKPDQSLTVRQLVTEHWLPAQR